MLVEVFFSILEAKSWVFCYLGGYIFFTIHPSKNIYLSVHVYASIAYIYFTCPILESLEVSLLNIIHCFSHVF